MDKKYQAVLDGVDVMRAWKDEEYRATLNPDQQQALAEQNPVTSDELSDDQLEGVTGGTGTIGCFNPNAKL